MVQYNKRVELVKNKNGISKKVLTLYRKDKKEFSKNEVQDIVDGLEAIAEKNDETRKIMIRALGPTGWLTLKGYNEDLALYDYDEYLDGKAKDKAKFKKFYQIQIYTITEKN